MKERLGKLSLPAAALAVTLLAPACVNDGTRDAGVSNEAVPVLDGSSATSEALEVPTNSELQEVRDLVQQGTVKEVALQSAPTGLDPEVLAPGLKEMKEAVESNGFTIVEIDPLTNSTYMSELWISDVTFAGASFNLVFSRLGDTFTGSLTPKNEAGHYVFDERVEVNGLEHYEEVLAALKAKIEA